MNQHTDAIILHVTALTLSRTSKIKTPGPRFPTPPKVTQRETTSNTDLPPPKTSHSQIIIDTDITTNTLLLYPTQGPPRHDSTMPPGSAKDRPLPQNHEIFDPWNSSSTGHQQAENPYANTTAWRNTRGRKLERQFRSGDCVRSADDEVYKSMAFDGTVGPLSPEGNKNEKCHPSNKGSRSGTGEWRWVSEAEAKRAHTGVRDIRSFMGVNKRKAGDEEGGGKQLGKKKREREKLEFHTGREGVSSPRVVTTASTTTSGSTSGSITSSTEPDSVPALANDATSAAGSDAKEEPAPKKIFAGVTVYVNGSTLPQISDHKLKHLLVLHGARISIAMARKTVSHIIVGKSGVAGAGAGGGLAARKLQQEIERGGWKGFRIVGVDW